MLLQALGILREGFPTLEGRILVPLMLPKQATGDAFVAPLG